MVEHCCCCGCNLDRERDVAVVEVKKQIGVVQVMMTKMMAFVVQPMWLL